MSLRASVATPTRQAMLGSATAGSGIWGCSLSHGAREREAGTHKVGGSEVVAHLALSRGVLRVVVVLLSGALDWAAQQTAPHGEVDGRDAQARHRTDDAAQPLECKVLVDSCRAHTARHPSVPDPSVPRTFQAFFGSPDAVSAAGHMQAFCRSTPLQRRTGVVDEHGKTSC